MRSLPKCSVFLLPSFMDLLPGTHPVCSLPRADAPALCPQVPAVLRCQVRRLVRLCPSCSPLGAQLCLSARAALWLSCVLVPWAPWILHNHLPSSSTCVWHELVLRTLLKERANLCGECGCASPTSLPSVSCVKSSGLPTLCASAAAAFPSVTSGLACWLPFTHADGT